MQRLVSILAAICVAMVLIAGAGAFLLSKIYIAQSKVDAVSAVAKGISLTLSEQVNLLNSMLDKMAHDPEIISVVAQNNPDLLASAEKKLADHFPGILSIKLLLPESKDPNKKANDDMGFADAEMVRRSFENNQPSAIQGGEDADRHLAIVRRITQNDLPIGVILARINYDFVKKILIDTTLDKGYIELRQGKLVLASVGKKIEDDELDDNPINVPNTDWQLYYENSGGTSIGEFSLMVCIVLIPSLVVALGFVTGYRKLSNLIWEDMTLLTKALKDIVTEKPLGDYPVKLGETRSLIATLAQFKRVLNDKSFEI